jgi:hypothetical protein
MYRRTHDKEMKRITVEKNIQQNDDSGQICIAAFFWRELGTDLCGVTSVDVCGLDRRSGSLSLFYLFGGDIMKLQFFLSVGRSKVVGF